MTATAETTAAQASLSTVSTLATTLMHEHGLVDWTFTFDSAKRRLGQCNHTFRRISVSKLWAAKLPLETVRNTILHEIAHALVGPGNGHGQAWRTMARRIGCTGDRCTGTGDVVLPAAWVGTCRAGHTTTRHRAPLRVFSCNICAPHGWSADAVLVWTHHGQPVPIQQMPARFRDESAQVERYLNLSR